ncbi:MAG: helix-turn-helix domain-containing protein, partial [Halobacteria archaeon]|nr:helix-turn-helix domain-containing protein [Halobacteria archaeon]
GRVIEDVRVRGDVDEDELSDELSAVFSAGGEKVYRFERGHDCACSRIERSGFPISDLRFRDDELHLVLHLTEVDELRDLLDRISDEVGDISVKNLVRSEPESGSDSDLGNSEPTVIDLGCLTDRQREVIRTAYSMGYFEYPRESTGEEVADEMGISVSTFSEHLSSAERKLFDALMS